MSFYVTKTVLVGPKWFWSDQIDLDLTIMIWLRPKWNGQVQIVILYQNESPFGPNQFNLVVTISFWLWPNHYGQVQINLVRPKPFWTNQNCFGHIEGQGIHILFWDRRNPRILSFNQFEQPLWVTYYLCTYLITYVNIHLKIFKLPWIWDGKSAK